MRRGRARLGRRTKELAKRIRPGELAVIAHPDLDELAAQSLIEAGAQAVINACPSVTGRYPNRGPQLLCDAGIPLLDLPGEGIFERIRDGDPIALDGERLLWPGGSVVGRLWDREALQAERARCEENLPRELRRFLANTLDRAWRERDLLFRELPLPALRTRLAGRHALVVVRGHRYREDLQAIAAYLRELRPVLIGVDGGADALLQIGCRPDLIVGDMDSVSDEALRSGAEILVHAYPDGRAPGLARVEALGLRAKTVAAAGTSEDLALLLAHQLQAELIVAVGTHTHMIDFLEKGRPGMASTLLTRLKVGPRLVDARGVSLLYRSSQRPAQMGQILAAAALPLAAVTLASPQATLLLRLWWLQARIALGW